MNMDTQGPKWQITINNPCEKGLTHEAIKDTLSTLKSIRYWCMADEKGLAEETPHTHIFIYCSKVRFSTIKRLFGDAHIEQAYGTAVENRDYVAKTGKWADAEKAKTSISGTFEEWGELPNELGAGFRSDIAEIYRMIADEGMTNAEIMATTPDFAMHIGKMDKIRQDILEARYRDTWRNLNVYYLWGPTETGKTRGVFERNGYSNVYRVTDYAHSFDRYAQEPVLCLDEFRSSLQIGDMLDYLDGYPLALPARYANRQACYETVYIISNIDLSAQYPKVQEFEPATWKAFLRRIHHVMEYRYDGEPIDHGSALEYIYPTTPQIWKKLSSDDGQETLPF